jgi:hypothetical protein
MGLPPRFLRLEPIGVGTNEPHPLSAVGRAGMDSTHHERPAGVASLLQRAEYPIDASTSDASNILKRKPNRSDVEDDADGRPK